MIFFVGNDGTIVKSSPSPVYQGAANANTIYLVAPFAANLTAAVAFQLPSGTATSPAPMTAQGTIEGITDEQGGVYSGWSYDLPNNITALYGTVIAQFFFYSAQGKVVASSAANFTVGRGVPAVLPEEPSDTVYDQILAAISGLQSDLHNGYYASRAIYAWNSTYTYGANEITFYPDIGQYGAFVKSLVADNTGHAPYADGAINASYWAEVVNFNTITDDFFAEIKAAQEAAEAAQEAAETAEANAEAAEQGAQAAQAAAETAQGKAEDAQAAAETAQAAAETSAGEAASSASAAADSAAEAADSATAAAESANNAAGSALEAQGYMEQAKEYAKKEYKLYDSVDDLPVPGDSAFIYLVPQTGSEENDNYAEYLWISETQRYEFIGTVNDIDLSNYAQKNGTYPDMTVGNAANANHAASADSANDPNAVHYTEQTLTAEQQAQARTNIGAASEEALEEGLAGKQPTGDYALQNGSYPDMAVGNATNANLAAQATKLATGRTIRTNLGSTAAPSFDGTANVTPGVTGILPVANGGTGKTNLANVTVGNATSAETAEKVANALTVTVNGEETEYDGSAAAAVTVSASNPNLLDNSNFAINQSGNTNPSNSRMVDRWVFEGASTRFYWYTRGDKPYKTGLQMQSQGSLVRAIQYFEKDLKRDGTHYTLTVGYLTSNSSDATIHEVTHTYPVEESNNAQDFSFELVEELFVQLHVLEKTSENHDNLEIRRTASSSQFIIILYIKLEEGDVATPYEIPDPATELLKCQRYYVKYSEDFQIAGTVSGTANTAYVTMFLPATMRTIPTIVSWNGSGIRLNGSSYSTVDDIDVQGCENNKLYLKIHTSADYPNMAICIWFGNSLELSAELTS